MSNTKLTLAQKEFLRDYRAQNPEIEIFHFPELRVCVGVRRRGENMGEFAVSICADSETKYRKKVGEYVVRERFEYGMFLPTVLGENDGAEWEESERDYLEEIARGIACAVNGY
jgi:hypothetical protein